MLDKGFVHRCSDPANCALNCGGGRKLATHPHNIWRVLHDEQRRGEIEYDELNEKLDRMCHNVEEYNCAVREINKGVHQGLFLLEENPEMCTRVRFVDSHPDLGSIPTPTLWP